MTCDVLLIRHGFSRSNELNAGLPENDRAIGEPIGGNPLTDQGREQARQLGKFLRMRLSDVPTFVVCSEAERAIHTCIESLPSSAFTTTSCLNEISKGEWEGRRVEEVITADVRHRIEQLNWYFRPPGGESREDGCQRALPYLEGCIKQGYQQLVVYSHLDLIRSLLTEILGLEKELAYRVSIANSSVSIVRHDGKWEDTVEYWSRCGEAYCRGQVDNEDR